MKLMNIVKIGMLLFMLGSVSHAFSTEYYISSADELSELNLKAGDIVIMKNGVWTNQDLKFVGTGTAENPIYLVAETRDSVILNGTSTLDIGGEYLIVDGLLFKEGQLSSGHIIEFRTSSSNLSSNCRLTNTRIIDYNGASDDVEYKWVSIYGKNNRVDHCEFTGKNHEGALLVIWLDRTDSPSPNYHRIDHNYFADIPVFSGGNGAEAIRIGTSDYSFQESRAIVEYNLFESCDGEIEIISNKSCYNVYRYNTFINSGGCLTLRHGNDCEVYSNFFFGGASKRSGGVRIIGENHKVYNNYIQDMHEDGFRAAISITNGVPDSPLNRYFQVKNAQIINNTLVNCEHPIVFGAGESSELSLEPLNCELANNIIARYSGSMDDMIEYEDTPTGTTYFNNIFYGGDLGITKPSGIEIMDPKLSEQNGVYRPDTDSPVIGYGTDIFSTLVNMDIDGQARGTSIDAGCDQISEDSVINYPLARENVGLADPLTINDTTNNDTVGIKIIKKETTCFQVYPNPSIGVFSVESESPGIISLYNQSGSLIEAFTMTENKQIIEVSDIPSGIYFIHYQTNEKHISKRIIIYNV